MTLRFLPGAFIDFLSTCGIEPNKVSEVYECEAKVDGSHLYIGFYHLVGHITRRPMRTDSTKFGNVWLSFNEECDLVPDGFPSPVLQLDFWCHIPWVLDEEPWVLDAEP